MARTREFNAMAALDGAMKVFWKKGYADTSIDDLVSATGVSRYGLYGEFGSKHGLFLAALDHYQETVTGRLFGMVEQPAASLNEIRTFFTSLVELSVTPAGRLGCLMCNTACEVVPHDKDAATKVQAYGTRLSAGFRHALQNAKARGYVAAGLNIEQAADFLAGIVQGLSVVTRSNASPKAIRNMAAMALTVIR